MKIFVHSDNGLGSARGDVDDGFAVAALLRSGLSLTALASTYGNTPEPRARENLRGLAAVAGVDVPVLRGAAHPGDGPTEASRFLAEEGDGLTVVALGPLTDVASALRNARAPWRELVVVGGNRISRGRWPPFWPFEFNFTQDPPATQRALAAEVPLTVIPLDVCSRMRVRYDEVALLPGPLGEHLARHARRWFRRALWLKGRRTVPVWDLVAAAAVAAPHLVTVESTTVRAAPNGWAEFGRGGRPARVATGFDGGALWGWLASVL